jgi:hypothetical protein
MCVGVQVHSIGALILGVTDCHHERLSMSKFIAIGYGDQKGYDNTAFVTALEFSLCT